MPAEATSDVISSLGGEIPYLRRYALAMTQQRADADDLVQECLEKALKRLNSFEPGSNLRAWLMKILHNLFIDRYRKNKRGQLVGEEHTSLNKGNYMPANQIHSLQVHEMEKALAKLPAKQRSTILLASLENLSYEEIAKVTNVPVGTVRSRLSRARAALTQSLEGRITDEPLPQPADSILVAKRHRAPALPLIGVKAKAA